MNKEFINAIEEIEKKNGIKKEELIDALEKALKKSYEKNFDEATNSEVEIDKETGDIKIFSLKEVVENVEDSNNQILLSTARTTVGKSVNLGDIVRIKVNPKEFGRVAAQVARSIIINKIREIEKNNFYSEFSDKLNTVIVGNITGYDGQNYFVDLGKTEGIIPKKEQIEKEHIKIGDRLKLYVKDVRENSRGVSVVLSRTHANFVAKLFEEEVPEISDGIVEIVSVAREAGERSKIAVKSNDPSVDPIGACIGFQSMRMKNIISQLNGEKIDIIKYSDDLKTYISNSLSPAEVKKVLIENSDDETKKSSILVTVPENILSLAIGKEGQNVRLAAKLTGYKIDIKPEEVKPVKIKNTSSDNKKLDIKRLSSEEIDEELLAKEALNFFTGGRKN